MQRLVRGLLAWVFRPFTERNKGNLRLIAGAFSLSSIIWLFNALNKEIEATLTIPLQLKYNNSYAPLGEVPQSVSAMVSGHGWQVVKAAALNKPEHIVIWIKNPRAESHFDTVVLRNFIESRLPHIKVKKMLMDSIQLPFDIKTQKWVRMKIDTSSLSIAKGYQIDSFVFFHPDSVLVTGPRKIVENIPDTIAIGIPYEKIDGNFEESFKLAYFLRNPNLGLSHEKIKVKFKVKKMPLSNGAN